MTNPVDLVPHRPFTTAEARALGLSRHQLRRLIESGVVRRVMRNVHAPASLPDSTELRADAAMLALPDHAVVVDRSAAWLHGIDMLDFAELDVVPELEVVSLRGHDRSRADGLLGGERDLRADDVTTVGTVRVTTPLRTACDLACLRGRLRAIAAIDAFRREFGLTEQDFARMLVRYQKRRGVTQLRELVPLSTGLADSQPESWVRLTIHDEGLPMPKPQVWVVLPGYGRARVENAYEHLRIGVEYDGEEHHTSDDDREHDETRRAALRAAGWIIIVVRKDGFTGEVRQAWLAELAAAIAERSPSPTTRRIYARSPESTSYRRPRR